MPWSNRQTRRSGELGIGKGIPLILPTNKSHIDTAWLWQYTHTQQKIARSWSTQLDLMERYPEHRFAASSAQQYAWLEELYPDVFASVKEQVKAGRFIPVGGAWLEHDCVLPSGESMCRQYLYGQRYFQEKFGVRCREAWLPDTFGYASQLPQILRLSGIDYFFTQKVRPITMTLRPAFMEQYQRLPLLHLQLDWSRRNPSLLPYDSCRHV